MKIPKLRSGSARGRRLHKNDFSDMGLGVHSLSFLVTFRPGTELDTELNDTTNPGQTLGGGFGLSGTVVAPGMDREAWMEVTVN